MTLLKSKHTPLLSLVDSSPDLGDEPQEERTESLSDAPLRILILNSHLPIFPGGGGVEYLTTRNLRRHAQRVGLVSMAHRREDLNKTSELTSAGVDLFLWESPHLDAPDAISSPPSVMRRIHTFLRQIVDRVQAQWRPLDTVALDGGFRNMADPLRTALDADRWDVLAIVESTAARMIDSVPRQLVSVLVMHDIRTLMYQRQALISTTPEEKRRALREAKRYERFERLYCERFDLVTTVSDDDAAWLRANYALKRVITVPLPVDANYFRPDETRSDIAGRIVFTGLMSHPPNADAAIFFAREVFPYIQAQIPSATFVIVGRHPTPEVQALASLRGVDVTGAVADIRPFLAQAAAVVVPLRYGSGARQKILEAWCMERCVISTRIGAEGLRYVDGESLLIADTAQTMADTVIRVLRDTTIRDTVRHAGRAVVLDRHNPERVAQNYYAELAHVVKEKRRQHAPMRIGIDMRWMLPGMAGGLENLARSFMHHLIEIDNFNQYTALLPARCQYDFDLAGHSNIRIVAQDTVDQTAQKLAQRGMRRLFSKLHLDYWKSPTVTELQFAASLHANIIYSFPGYIRPDVKSLRHILMVPDIQHEFFPEFFPNGALEERRRLYGESIEHADHICAISEFTRQTLIDRLGVPPAKITTIPLAADPIFKHAPDQRDAAILASFGLTAGEYLFFPAHTWSHKNHLTLIAALQILAHNNGLKPTLVCTGGAREAQPLIEQAVQEAGIAEQILFIGYLPHTDLPTLYRGALALVFPSLFEGFGMPVLEAMACGCPVICSNTTSLPEIAGDAALLVDPTNPSAFATAIHTLIDDRALATKLQQRGLVQAAKFSWKRHTRETVAVFHKVYQDLYGWKEDHHE